MKSTKNPILALTALLLPINISAQQQAVKPNNAPQAVAKLSSVADSL